MGSDSTTTTAGEKVIRFREIENSGERLYCILYKQIEVPTLLLVRIFVTASHYFTKAMENSDQSTVRG